MEGFEDDYNLYLSNYEEHNYLAKLKYDLDSWTDSTSHNLEKIIGLLSEQGYITIKENQQYKDCQRSSQQDILAHQ